MTVALPMTREFNTIRHLPVPAYNPLNPLDASIPLAHPCATCGAHTGQRCGQPCTTGGRA